MGYRSVSQHGLTRAVDVMNNYTRWRSTIPWNNIQIATAIRAAANAEKTDWMRERTRLKAVHLLKTGKLNRWALGVALPFLITTCALCEKKALYRIGTMGRCSEHKTVGLEAAHVLANQRVDAKSASRNAVDRLSRLSDNKHAFHRSRELRKRSG